MNSEIPRAVFGIAVFIAIAWLLSENRRAFPIRSVVVGLAAQVLLAVVLTRVPAAIAVFAQIARGVNAVQSASSAGTTFVFGYLGGGKAPFPVNPGSSTFIFAFQALPAILLVGALSALLWHWRILIWIVRGSAWLFGWLFQVSGPVGMSSSACIFLGMVEAPLLIRPYLARMSRGEIFILMVDGLSVVGGSTMVFLGALLSARMPHAFQHLLIASLISTPMAIGMARVMIPVEARTQDAAARRTALPLDSRYGGSLDALTQGTLAAVKMVINIVGLLIVFVSMIALIDKGLALFPHAGGAPITLALLLGKVLSPVAWLMGVPMGDLQQAGALLGTKVLANEVVAFTGLLGLPPGAIQPKTLLMLTYSLCSFGNFGSVAILIGSMSTMAPEKVGEVVDLGFKALLAAFLTTCISGTVIGVISSLF